MKGIVLAGGSGTRLYPATKVMVKQLLPIYDKPMVYYPMSVLMLAGIKDILIISTPENLPSFQRLFGNGKKLGLSISYEAQEKPNGLAEAFIIGESFIGKDDVCLVLGDNLFYGQAFANILRRAVNSFDGELSGGALVFGCPVKDPKRFGVCEFDAKGNVTAIVEKPAEPKSNYAVPGLYFYSSSVVDIAKRIKPSERGELEITAVNNEYIKQNKLKVQLFGRGMAWFDTGTPSALQEAGGFIEMIQNRQGTYIACLEEIAWRMGFITTEQLRSLGEEISNSEYGKYILYLAGEAE